MKQSMTGWMTAGILGAAMVAEAHLGAMSIKGGEKFKVGQVVNVTVDVTVPHSPNKFDLSYSTNGGTSFEAVETKTMTGSGVKTFAWTVPDKPSTTARFQICQWSGTDACSYKAASQNFTIEAATSLARPAPAAGSPLRFDPASRNLDVSFELAREERIQVVAYDAGGKRVATLLDSRYGAGSHRLSLFSNRLDGASVLLFQLHAGGKVHSLGPVAVR